MENKLFIKLNVIITFHKILLEDGVSFECFGIRLFEKIKTQTKYDIMGGEGAFWS